MLSKHLLPREQPTLQGTVLVQSTPLVLGQAKHLPCGAVPALLPQYFSISLLA